MYSEVTAYIPVPAHFKSSCAKKTLKKKKKFENYADSFLEVIHKWYPQKIFQF